MLGPMQPGQSAAPASTSPSLRPARSLRVSFPGSAGHDLAGELDLPASEPRAFAVFAHCFTCSKDSHAAARISGALTRHGLAVLRFDFTGLGASEGDFADTVFSSNVADLVAAAAWLRETHEAPTLLVGHSLGGAAVLAAAGSVPEARAVVTIAAPASPTHVQHVFSDVDDSDGSDGSDGHGEGALRVDIGGRPFRLHRDFLTDLAAQPQADRIAGLGRALLVLHSPTDQVVGIDNAREIFDTARHPKSFVALDGAGHLLPERADAAFAADVIAAWADRYLPQVHDEVDPEQPAPDLTVTELSATSGFAHLAAVRHHSWTLDEPESVGGADQGPDPYETLLSALGACTSMTMRMYARRKGWEYGASTVRLEHARIHAADCATCETTEGMVDHIHRVITLDPALSDEQRDALVRIADRCPVHRTLTHEVAITTTLADPEETP